MMRKALLHFQILNKLDETILSAKPETDKRVRSDMIV